MGDTVAVKQQAAFDQEAWDRYVDSRIELFLSSHRVVASSEALPDALHEALGQVLAEQRRQWDRERARIESESAKTIAELGRERRSRSAWCGAAVCWLQGQ